MDFKTPKHINYDLLAKYMAGEASVEEVEKVVLWASESPENQAHLNELQFMWTDAFIPDELESLPAADVDVDLAWDKMKARVNKPSQQKALRPVHKSSRLFYFARIAAGLLFLLAFAWLFYLNLERSSPQKTLVATSEIISETLSDGSRIQLNENSTVEFAEKFSGRKREVKLKGEAFFEVEPDTKKPFIVQADELIIQVLGTAFNVKSIESVDSTVVHVERGRVALRYAEQEVILSANMTGIFQKKTKQLYRYEQIDPAASYWRTQSLTFKSTKLSEVVKTLNAVYKTNIRFANPALKDCLLSVDFKQESIEGVLDIIQSTFNLEVSKTDNSIVLNGEGC